MYYVFFSSRRRHTRYWRDWSSDVCSSDLAAAFGKKFSVNYCGQLSRGKYLLSGALARDGRRSSSPDAIAAARSEERRVGKECRSRWSAEQLKKMTDQGERG